MGNLVLAAPKGMFMQRLSFELATCIARMVDFKCQLQVADGE